MLNEAKFVMFKVFFYFKANWQQENQREQEQADGVKHREDLLPGGTF